MKCRYCGSTNLWKRGKRKATWGYPQDKGKSSEKAAKKAEERQVESRGNRAGNFPARKDKGRAKDKAAKKAAGVERKNLRGNPPQVMATGAPRIRLPKKQGKC